MWEKERKEDEAREEIILSGSSGVVCRLLLFLSVSLPLSLVSSALLSSRLMEQSMQIARVDRARDRREERRVERGERDNTGVQRLSSAPPIGRHVNAAAMSGWIYSKYNLQPAQKKTFSSSSWLSLQVCASFGVTGFRVNYRLKEMKSKNIPYSHSNIANHLAWCLGSIGTSAQQIISVGLWSNTSRHKVKVNKLST